jgi:DNA topoisomerase III
LAIVSKRELEIRNFVPIAYFEVVATAKVAGGQFQMRHAPQDRIVRREIAEAVANAAQGFEGALAVRVEDKRQGPPKLHDLPSLQKICGSRFGWPAGKTLEVAQELYDGQGKKIITYPRAEVRYLPTDVPRIVAGLRVGQSFSAIPVPEPPVIRKGASGSFYDKGLEGASHHAIIPNVNMIDKLRDIWPRLSSDEKKLVDVIARAYLVLCPHGLTRIESPNGASAVARTSTSWQGQLRLNLWRRRRGLGNAKLTLPSLHIPLHRLPRSQIRLQVRRYGFLMATRRSL